jgi:hypothetical protein
MVVAFGALVLCLVFGATQTQAVPTFARKYKTSCSTCHYAFPRLNSFGNAFRNNAFRYPGDDRDMIKEEPVSLGSEGNKKAFPNAIWPADIPGATTISFRWISRVHYEPNKRGGEQFSFENPHELEAFMPGTIGDNLSFFFELGWEHAHEFGFGGRLDYKFANAFHVRVGNIDYLPIQDFERLTREHYNYGGFEELDASGLEFWGAANGPANKGGLVYSLGMFNGENDGEENIDLNSQKDVFAKASYKIGGTGVLGSTMASPTSAFWKDNSIALGAFGHFGKNSDDSKNRNLGGNINFFHGNLNVFGLYMVSGVKALDTGGYVNTNRAFVEADYVIYPWLIPLGRFEYTKEKGQEAEKRIIPAIVIMARANVKIIPTGRFDLQDSKNNRYNLQFEVGI